MSIERKAMDWFEFVINSAALLVAAIGILGIPAAALWLLFG